MSFDPNQSIGALPRHKIVEYLREIGDDDAADQLEPKGGAGQAFSLGLGGETYGHTGMLIGFLPPQANAPGVIQDAMSMKPDETLRGARIKITLERFWVDRYPGRGRHKILCEFTGKSQIQGEAEELRYALSTEANDGASAAVVGAPIFVGASVGNNGISFEGRTINVSNSVDDGVLAALNSGAFKQGLSLLTTAQPALKPFVGLASSIVSAVASRNRNKQVYDFKLGLDFEMSQTSAKMREGSFIVVQGDASYWSWAEVEWNPSSQQLVRKFDGQTIRYNYLIFRVSRYVD
jgi:hypothetical protein